MREAEHFFIFLLNRYCRFGKIITKNNKDLRIWCAASSTGEEPYTLAMILEDYFKNKNEKWDKNFWRQICH